MLKKIHFCTKGMFFENGLKVMYDYFYFVIY